MQPQSMMTADTLLLGWKASPLLLQTVTKHLNYKTFLQMVFGSSTWATADFIWA